MPPSAAARAERPDDTTHNDLDERGTALITNDPHGAARAEYEGLHDIALGYPANHFAFRYILNALAQAQARTVVEVGIGHGNAVPLLSGAGLSIAGFDIDDSRVAASQAAMRDFGQDPARVIWGDIEDPLTYAPILAGEGHDALVALGVLPHVLRERQTLANMRALVRPGGQVFVEFRNKLFSLVTFNRFTLEFLMDDLLSESPESLRAAARTFIGNHVNGDVPPAPSEARPPRFHNPLEMPALFAAAGFEDIVVRPFHYHAAMPAVADADPQAFRDGSIALEHEPSDWKGLFLCSAFLVHARRGPA